MKQSINKRTILLALAIAALAASSFNFMRPTNADFTVTTFFVSPQTPAINSTLTFTVNIGIGYVYQMTSYEIHVDWDPTLLNLTKITNGVLLSNNSQIPTSVYKLQNNNIGTLGYIETQTQPTYFTAVGTGVGNGTLFTLTFTAISTGSCVLHLHDQNVKFLENTVPNVATVDGYFNNQQITYPYAGVNYNATIVSNSTAHDLNFNFTAETLSFNVSGPTGTTGYANITIPRGLMDVDPGLPPGVWVVILDGVPTTSFVATSNATYTSIYLTYTHSDHSILLEGNKVGPEISPDIFMLIILVASLAILLPLARRTARRPQVPPQPSTSTS